MGYLYKYYGYMFGGEPFLSPELNIIFEELAKACSRY